MTERAFPRWFRIAGWCAVPFAAGFTIRITYEETYLAWVNGPQMIGFSLVHVYPEWFMLGVAGLVAVELWDLTAIIIGMRRKWQFSMADWIQFATLSGLILVDLIPTSWWQYLITTAIGSAHP